MNSMNIISIDVEDWYQSSLDIFNDSTVAHGGKPAENVVDNTLKTLDILTETNNKATFFVLGTVAEYFPDLVKEILLKGHEVASHGYSHKLVYNMMPDDFQKDIELSLCHLYKAGCNKVLGYRAPYWSITKKSLWALDILHGMHFVYDSSIFPIHRGLYGIPGASRFPHKLENGMWEFPPATIRVMGLNVPIAGGGYLRLLPYKLITSAIKKTAGEQVRVFYFHPYELDPQDIKLGHKTKSLNTIMYWLQQVVGRKSNPEKLKNLMQSFNFVSFESYISTEFNK